MWAVTLLCIWINFFKLIFGEETRYLALVSEGIMKTHNKSCIMYSEPTEGSKASVNGKSFAIPMCAPMGKYEFKCGRFRIFVDTFGYLPVAIIPNVKYIVGVRPPPISCDLTLKESYSNRNLQWELMDGLGVFEIVSNSLILKMEITTPVSATYGCFWVNNEKKYRLIKKTFILYPEPKFEIKDKVVVQTFPNDKFPPEVKMSTTFLHSDKENPLNFASDTLEEDIYTKNYVLTFHQQVSNWESTISVLINPSALDKDEILKKYKVEISPDIDYIIPGNDYLTVSCYQHGHLTERGIGWKHVSGPVLFYIRGDKLIEGYNLKYSSKATYACSFFDVQLLLREFTVMKNPLLFTIPAPEPIRFDSGVRHYKCAIDGETTPKMIPMAQLPESSMTVFRVNGSQINVTALHAGEYAVQCSIEYYPRPIESSIIFKIIVDPKIFFNDSTIMSTSKMNNFTCYIDPPRLDSVVQRIWRHLDGGISHIISDKTPEILIAKTNILPMRNVYECSVHFMGAFVSKTVNLCILPPVVTVVEVATLVQFIGRTFTLHCKSLHEFIKIESEIVWKLSFFILGQGTAVDEKTGTGRQITYEATQKGYLDSTCRVSGGTSISSRIMVQDEPKLFLEDENDILYIYEYKKDIICVAGTEKGNYRYPGRIRWIGTHQKAIIAEDRMRFAFGDGQTEDIKMTCSYSQPAYNVTREFTFYATSLKSLHLGQKGRTPHLLASGASCDETCASNMPDADNLKKIDFWWSDLRIEKSRMSQFAVNITGNKRTCNYTDIVGNHYMCMFMICNGRLGDQRLIPRTLMTCYAEKKATVSFPNFKKEVLKGGAINCVSDGSPKFYIRILFTTENEQKEINILPQSGSLAVIPIRIQDSSLTVHCKAFLETLEYHTLLGSKSEHFTLTGLIDYHMKSKRFNRIMAGDTLLCESREKSTVASIFVIDDMNFDGFKNPTRKELLIPSTMRMKDYIVGCRVAAAKHIRTKFYTVSPTANDSLVRLTKTSVKLTESFRCYSEKPGHLGHQFEVRNSDLYGEYTIFCPHGDTVKGLYVFDKTCPVGKLEIICMEITDGITSATEVFNMTVEGYDLTLDTGMYFSEKINIKVVALIGVIWCFLLLFNALMISYHVHHSTLNRYLVISTILDIKSGGTRPNKRVEGLPFVYISRNEMDGRRFRNLRLSIDRFHCLLHCGQHWFLMWCLDEASVRMDVLKEFSDFLNEDGKRIDEFQTTMRSSYRASTYYTKSESIYSRPSMTEDEEEDFEEHVGKRMRRPTIKE